MSPRSDREHTRSPRLLQAVTGENYSPCFMRAHKEPAWSARPAAATQSLRREAVFLHLPTGPPPYAARPGHPSKPARPPRRHLQAALPGAGPTSQTDQAAWAAGSGEEEEEMAGRRLFPPRYSCWETLMGA